MLLTQYLLLKCIQNIKSIFRINSESELTTFLHTENNVYDLERDLYMPGNILFSDGSAMKTTDGSSTSLIAGSAYQLGYVEGVGSQARFYYIFVISSTLNKPGPHRRSEKLLFEILESHYKSNRPICR